MLCSRVVFLLSCSLLSSSLPFLLGELAAEHENVGLGLVDHVVHPPDGLLHAELAPLILVHQHVAGDVAAVLLREDDVAVLVLVVEILLRVEDLRLHLGEEHAGLLALEGVGQREVVGALGGGGHDDGVGIGFGWCEFTLKMCVVI